jgi:phage antirepressor YoqD-like protein
MSNIVCINNKNIGVKEYKGKRVVTFKEIDEVHGRPEGTARRNFYKNTEHFTEGEDYFKISMHEIRTMRLSERNIPQGMNLITESGYLMLVKSLTDDLSWKVQKQLVNTYFRFQEVKEFVQEFQIPRTMSEALRLAADIEEQRVKLAEENRILLPKAESFDTFISATGNLTIEEAAKTLNIKGIGRNKLFELLVEEGILFKKGFGEYSHYEAYQQYTNSGYFVHKQIPFKKGGEIVKRTQVFVTPKGLDWLAKTMKRKGYKAS